MEQEEKTVENIIEGSVTIATLLYSFMIISFKGQSDEYIAAETKKWAKDSTANTIKALNKAGFTIVKQEPALENFPSLT
jgi:hypothetical protein